MDAIKNFFKNSSLFAKIFVIGVIVGLYFLCSWGYNKIYPKQVKKANVTTSAKGLPTLAYDKGSNAPLRTLPQFNEPVEIASPEIRGAVMAWNGFSAANYAIGGTSTSKGSLCEELGLNVHVAVQNSCTEQGNQLYAFAQDLHEGTAQPTKGVHFVNWMGDGVPNYLASLNTRLIKDFGEEYRAVVVTFAGASFGEDKWLLKPKYAKDARGSLTCTVVRDGDWNIAIIKCQLMGWDVNYEPGTYDKKKVNFLPAPNDDYIEAGKLYISGQKTTLKIVEGGKYTGKDTTIACTGVATWFPGDAQVMQQKGSLVTVASTKDYAAQMGCAIIMISKWCNDNRALVEKFVEAIGRGGDQIKSHDEALRFACQVNEVVFNDKEKTAEDWYKAYTGYPVADEDRNEIIAGGSRTFSLSDAANYTGVNGSTDTYKKIYTTFGNICREAYPEVLAEVFPYEKATDWTFLKQAYTKAKQAGTAGIVSKTDFTTAQKSDVVAGDRAYSIEFATGSAVISPESYAILEQISNLLTNANNMFVEVSGHTDNTGNPGANQSLSAQRAQSVVAWLKEHNTDLNEAGKMSSKGYGQTQPLNPTQDQNDATVRSKNRRVEIKLYAIKQ